MISGSARVSPYSATSWFNMLAFGSCWTPCEALIFFFLKRRFTLGGGWCLSDTDIGIYSALLLCAWWKYVYTCLVLSDFGGCFHRENPLSDLVGLVFDLRTFWIGVEFVCLSVIFPPFAFAFAFGFSGHGWLCERVGYRSPRKTKASPQPPDMCTYYD